MAAAEKGDVKDKARKKEIPANGLTRLSRESSQDFILEYVPIRLTTPSILITFESSIVFVHGLGGHPFRTWACNSPHSQQPKKQDVGQPDSSLKLKSVKKQFGALFGNRRSTSQDESKDGSGDGPKTMYWPGDFLAKDFPAANVMTWGYNSDLTRGYLAGSQGTIFSHARNLLYSLVSERRGSPERPLVFIAHSLGGIMVKEVLRRSEFDFTKEVRQISLSTSGIIFYGTPHRGSPDWASFGEGIAKIATFVTGIETNSNLIHSLLPSGSELEECRESFARQWQGRQHTLIVRTYQEGRGPSGVKLGRFHKKAGPPSYAG
jgi:hypothetical protein